MVVAPEDYDDVIVTVAHLWADVETTLRQWIETGPGPRPLVTITMARRRNGDPVPLDDIPLQYRNSRESRRLQRLGLLPSRQCRGEPQVCGVFLAACGAAGLPLSVTGPSAASLAEYHHDESAGSANGQYSSGGAARGQAPERPRVPATGRGTGGWGCPSR